MARTPHKVPAGYLSRAQAAAFLGVSPATFQRWIKKYDLRERIEKSVHLYRVEEIERLAATVGGDA